jgi:hypothetical protein
MEGEEHAMGSVDGQCQVVGMLNCGQNSSAAICQIDVHIWSRLNVENVKVNKIWQIR